MSKLLVLVGRSESRDLTLGHIFWKICRKGWFLVRFKTGYRCKP